MERGRDGGVFSDLIINNMVFRNPDAGIYGEKGNTQNEMVRLK